MRSANRYIIEMTNTAQHLRQDKAMKAYEFSAKVTSDGRLEMPDILLKDVPCNQEVKIIVLVKETAEIERQEDSDWSLLAVEQFFSDDNQADAIYNQI